MTNHSEWEQLDKEIDSMYEKFTTGGARADLFYVNLLKHACKKMKLQYYPEREILNFVGAAFVESASESES